MVLPTVFIGRSKELDEVTKLVDDGARLVTLWGPGGAGKTTLARHVVERLRAAGTGVVWIELSAARSEADTIASLAAALEVPLDPADDAAEAVARAFRAQPGWVAVDNVEQLPPRARAWLAALVDAPGASLLVTSRDALASASERAVRIDPLSVGDALALYTALSGVEADDAAREIVRRLDALPLAIELAAARAPLLGSTELLARLGRKLDVLGGPRDRADRPARHTTLRAAIGWSWDLLDEVDRAALGACASFDAPFDAALAVRLIVRIAAVRELDDPELGAMNALERLRQRALVHVGSPDPSGRPELRLLEAVRDFAAEQRAQQRADVDDDVRAAFAAAVLERTEPLAAVVRRGGAVPPELARRRPDLLALSANPRHGARPVLVLAALLGVTGPLGLVVECVDALLPGVRNDPELAARLTIARGSALRAMGRHADAEAAAASALAEATAIPDALMLQAEAYQLAGTVARSRGEASAAASQLERAGVAYAAIGERALAGICLGELGAAYGSAGQLDLALARHADAIALHVAEGSARAEGVSRSYLAVATHRAGDPGAALPLHEAALAIHRAVGHRRMEGAELLHLGFVHHEIDAGRAARVALADARSVLAAAGARGLEALALILAARLDVDEGDTSGARLRLAEAASCAPRGWARLESTRLLVMGHLALRSGDAPAAARAYEEARVHSGAVEVGFEALTPAYLALALARTDAPAAAVRARVDAARALVAGVTNPHVREAFALLEASAVGSVARPPGSGALASSSEVRRALAFAAAAAAARPGPRGLRIGADAKQVVLPSGETLDLSRRKNVRLVLAALGDARAGHPGVPVSTDALIAAGWPGERMRADAATKRLHTAIWTLRSLGLEGVLVFSDEGYFLDPAVPLL